MSAWKSKLRIRFRTRTLLVCVVLVCAAAAWLGWRVRKGRRQYQSATAISQAGNIVLYRHYFDAKGTFITGPTPSPPHPEWVKKAFGELTFASVDRLTIGSRFSDKDAAHLPNLFTLEELDLSDRKVTDQAMKHIGKMKALRKLSLHGTNITDEGMASLARLRRLESLNVSSTAISNKGLTYLKRLDRLAFLNLSHTTIANTQALNELDRLESIDLSHTSIGNATLESITRHSKLRRLRLAQTQITDAGLRFVARLPTLSSLDVEETQITLAGLRELFPLRELRRLHLYGCDVSTREAIDLFTHHGGRSYLDALELLGIMRDGSIIAHRDYDFTNEDLLRLGEQRGAKEITHLRFPGTDVTDAGVASLVSMPRLQTLDLEAAKITDESVAALKELKQLTFLSLPSPSLSDEAVAALRRALPKLRVWGVGGSPLATEVEAPVAED